MCLRIIKHSADIGIVSLGVTNISLPAVRLPLYLAPRFLTWVSTFIVGIISCTGTDCYVYMYL